MNNTDDAIQSNRHVIDTKQRHNGYMYLSETVVLSSFRLLLCIDSTQFCNKKTYCSFSLLIRPDLYI